MALIKGFRATTFWKAFLLNAIANTFIVVVAVFLKTEFEKLDKHDVKTLDVGFAFATIGATFLAAMMAYGSLYYLFHFGGGFLALQTPKDTKDKSYTLHLTEKNHKTGKTTHQEITE